MRDDFSDITKDLLAKRVGFRCSNPNCRKPTSGPQKNTGKTINVGVAAHITAASPGGKRYNANLSSVERQNVNNGIWLCQTCGKLIDNDELRYTVELLNKWKKLSEEAALLDIEQNNQPPSGENTTVISINQSGGQTAKTIINHRPPNRSFLPHAEFIKSRLKTIIPIPYIIQVLAHDYEAVSLGNELKEIFHQAGWTHGDIRKGIGGTHPPGIIITKDKDSEQFNVICNTIYETGLKEVFQMTELRGECIQIYIGPNP